MRLCLPFGIYGRKNICNGLLLSYTWSPEIRLLEIHMPYMFTGLLHLELYNGMHRHLLLAESKYHCIAQHIDMWVKHIPSSNLIFFYHMNSGNVDREMRQYYFRFCIIIFSTHIFPLLSGHDYEFIVFPITALNLLWTVFKFFNRLAESFI